MSKSIQLQVPEPCQASWNEMEKTDRGRFCLSCQKQVVDFSLMSDQEIFTFISSSNKKLCGHFSADQLNRNISVKRARKLGWFRYFIHVMIPALVLVNRSHAQDKIKPVNLVFQSTSSPVQIRLGELSVTPQTQKEYVIKGRVVEEDHQPIAGATIMVKGTNHGTATDADGNFQMLFDKPKNVLLIISGIGFEAKELMVNMGGQQNLELIVVQMKPAIAGGLVVVSTTTRRKIDTTIFKKIKNMILAPAKTNDTVKIYPNPVSAGAMINLSFDINKPGEYNLTMINISGQTVLQKNINTQNTKQVEQIQCDGRLPKGIYTVQVINLATKKIMDNKILVL